MRVGREIFSPLRPMVMPLLLSLTAIAGGFCYVASEPSMMGLVALTWMLVLLMIAGGAAATVMAASSSPAVETSQPSAQTGLVAESPFANHIVADPVRAEPRRQAFDVEAMVKALDDTLALARVASAARSLEAVDVRGLLDSLASERAVGPGAAQRLTIAGQSRTLFALADRPALRRLFACLIDTSLASAPRVKISLDHGTTALVVHVDDNGPGVPRSERARIFDPVYRLERGSASPYGRPDLAIAEKIANAHGGRIIVAASPDGGARFTVQLPRLGEHEIELQAAAS